jgi:hypothetical protein
MVGGEGHKVLQGSVGLAAVRGFGCFVLQVDQQVPEIRFVRNYQSASSVISISGGKHSRGARTRNQPAIHTVSENCAGISQRNRNAHYHCWQVGVGQKRRSETGTQYVRGDRKNYQITYSRNTGKKMISPLATRHSPFASDTSHV